MAEEFDIMKPISADLDIGSTMFDTPKPVAQQNSTTGMSGVSADLDIGSTMFDNTQQMPPKQYTPPRDNGKYNPDYGYLTAAEAEFISDISDKPKEYSSGDDAAAAAGSDDDSTPLERAIDELNSMGAATGGAAAPPPRTVEMKPYNMPQNSDSTDAQKLKVVVNGSPASGMIKAVAISIFIVSAIFIISVFIMISTFNMN